MTAIHRSDQAFVWSCVLSVCTLLSCGQGGGPPAQAGSPAAPPLTITTSSLTSGLVGSNYSPQAIQTTGGSGAGYGWTVSGGALPPGLTLTEGTPSATLAGTPTEAGTFGFTVQVQDSQGQTATRDLSLQVNPLPLPPPLLTITTSSLTSGLVGSSYSQAIQATGGSGAGYGWTVSVGALPPGLTLTSGTPSATLAGTPTEAGTFGFTVQVQDSLRQVATQGLSLQIDAPPAPPSPVCAGGSPPSAVITEKARNFTTFPEPALPSLPSAGVKTTDPTFGTTILRLTDATTGKADMGVDSVGVEVQYSYWPVFNANCTRLHVVGSYPVSRSVFFTFDPTKMEATFHKVLKKEFPLVPPRVEAGLLERSDMIWSGVDHDVIYGHDQVTQLWAYNVAADQYTLIKNFPFDNGNGVLPSGGIRQMSKSLDDQVFAFSLTDGAGASKGYLVWRRNPDQILARKIVTDVDEVQVDKSGKFLFVGYTTGKVDVLTLDNSGKVVSLNESEGFFHHDSGQGTMFTAGGPDDDFRFWDWKSDKPKDWTPLIPGFRSVGTQQDHFSMLADNERWALVSRYSTTNPSGGGGLFDNEIIQVATDDSNRVRRLAHHRSIMEFPGEDNTPKANISRDGRFVAFISNWGVPLANGGRRDVYIAIIPPAPTN